MNKDNRAELLTRAVEQYLREIYGPHIGRSRTSMHEEVATIIVRMLPTSLDEGPVDVVPERHNLIGFQIIGDMSREELIQECLAFHRMHCETVTNNELKKAIVTSRAVMFQKRLLAEAKLDQGGESLFSWLNQ